MCSARREGNKLWNQAWSLANPLIFCARHPPRNWSKDVVSIYCPVIFRQKLRSTTQTSDSFFSHLVVYFYWCIQQVKCWSASVVKFLQPEMVVLACFRPCVRSNSSKKNAIDHIFMAANAARRRIAGPITCCPMQCTGLASPPARTKKLFSWEKMDDLVHIHHKSFVIYKVIYHARNSQMFSANMSTRRKKHAMINIMVELKIVQFINRANSAFSMPRRKGDFLVSNQSRGSYHGPPKPKFLEVFMVNNLVFRWPKPLFFMVLGAHGINSFFVCQMGGWNTNTRPPASFSPLKGTKNPQFSCCTKDLWLSFGKSIMLLPPKKPFLHRKPSRVHVEM